MNSMVKCPQCGSGNVASYRPGMVSGNQYHCKACGYTGPVMQSRMLGK